MKVLLKNEYFRIFLGFVFLFVFLFGLHFVYTYYAFDYRYKNEEPAISDYTNVDPLYDVNRVSQTINQYLKKNVEDNLPEEYKGLPDYNVYTVDINDENTYIIPGLRQTKTLDVKNMSTMCTSMTPQGICITEKYVFISSYCHTHQHNSVIYMIDKATHEFIKEIVLDGQYHLGNICYDPVNQNIWAACTGVNNATGKKCAYLNALSLESIEAYDFNEENKSLHFIKKYALAEFKNASFISFYKGNIFVGVYYEGLWKNSYVQRFPINSQGGLDAEIQKGINGNQRVVYGKEKAKISECCQGFYYTGDVVMVMQSSGTKNSTIQYFYESKFEKDINESLRLDEEFRVYSDQLRVVDTLESDMQALKEEMDTLEQEKEDLEKRIKENKKKQDESEKSNEELLEDVLNELEENQNEYERLSELHEDALSKLPRFNVASYFKRMNTVKEYSIFNEKATISLTFPPRLEQAMVSDLEDYKKTYLLFESAAYSYSAQSNDAIDRVVVIEY